MHLDAAERLLIRALEAGAPRRTPRTVEWDVAGRCERPQFVGNWVRPDGLDVRKRKRVPLPVGVDLWLPCRKCGACLRARARLWRRRAMIELGRAGRSWFGTMTLSPDQHSRIANLIRVQLDRGGTDFDGLPPGEQYAERHRVISQELTKWLKRVRKESGAGLRYCLVAEAHESGLPHYHILVHEHSGVVLKRQMQQQWAWGFSSFKLAEPAAAGYLTKYLSKSALARVRASVLYGEDESVSYQSGSLGRGVRGEGFPPPSEPRDPTTLASHASELGKLPSSQNGD